MIYAILAILGLVGLVGYLWTDKQILKEKLQESEDFCAELDPVELYWEDKDG